MSKLDIFDNIQANRILVKTFGADLAVYWAQLAEILSRVKDKKTYDDNGYFTLNRKYIEEQLGYNTEIQFTLEAQLSKIEVLQKSEEDLNKIRIDTGKMLGFILQEDPESLKASSKLLVLTAEEKQEAKRQAKITDRAYQTEIKEKVKQQQVAERKEGQKIGMKAIIDSLEPNSELREFYYDWIEAVYERGYFLNKSLVTTFKNEINKYSKQRNLNTAQIKDLLTVAARLGYAKAEWIINQYEKQYSRGGVISSSQIKANSKKEDTDTLNF